MANRRRHGTGDRNRSDEAVSGVWISVYVCNEGFTSMVHVYWVGFSVLKCLGIYDQKGRRDFGALQGLTSIFLIRHRNGAGCSSSSSKQICIEYHQQRWALKSSVGSEFQENSIHNYTVQQTILKMFSRIFGTQSRWLDFFNTKLLSFRPLAQHWFNFNTLS